MSLTCTRCLAGDQHRCLRGDCANWKTHGGPRPSPRRAVRRSTAERWWTPNPAGRPRTTTPEQDRQIAQLVCAGNGIRTVGDHLGVPLSAVVRAKHELRALAAAGIDAGPVEPALLSIRRGGRAYGAHADPERLHKAALLLLEGATLERTAEVAGIKYNQARTVRSNLRVLRNAEILR